MHFYQYWYSNNATSKPKRSWLPLSSRDLYMIYGANKTIMQHCTNATLITAITAAEAPSSTPPPLRHSQENQFCSKISPLLCCLTRQHLFRILKNSIQYYYYLHQQRKSFFYTLRRCVGCLFGCNFFLQATNTLIITHNICMDGSVVS